MLIWVLEFFRNFGNTVFIFFFWDVGDGGSSGWVGDGSSRNSGSVVCGDAAPDKPPKPDEVVEGEARASFQNTHRYQKIKHGQPLVPKHIYVLENKNYIYG